MPAEDVTEIVPPLIVDYPQISLRFVERVISATRTVRVLQQQWVRAEMSGGLARPIATEWRDVPLVEEGGMKYPPTPPQYQTPPDQERTDTPPLWIAATMIAVLVVLFFILRMAAQLI